MDGSMEKSSGGGVTVENIDQEGNLIQLSHFEPDGALLRSRLTRPDLWALHEAASKRLAIHGAYGPLAPDGKCQWDSIALLSDHFR
jgi:hypothetical protein